MRAKYLHVVRRLRRVLRAHAAGLAPAPALTPVPDRWVVVTYWQDDNVDGKQSIRLLSPIDSADFHCKEPCILHIRFETEVQL